MAKDFVVTMRMVESFFDRPTVIDAVERANKRSLGKAGAFVKQRAKTSIRRRKKVSKPGQPPSAHDAGSRNNLKDIQFFYEPASETVVVGPVKLNGHEGNVPSLMEFGGRKTITEFTPRRGRRAPRVKRRQAIYKPRPFMGPALKKEAPKFPDLFAGGVR